MYSFRVTLKSLQYGNWYWWNNPHPRKMGDTQNNWTWCFRETKSKNKSLEEHTLWSPHPTHPTLTAHAFGACVIGKQSLIFPGLDPGLKILQVTCKCNWMAKCRGNLYGRFFSTSGTQITTYSHCCISVPKNTKMIGTFCTCLFDYDVFINCSTEKGLFYSIFLGFGFTL